VASQRACKTKAAISKLLKVHEFIGNCLSGKGWQGCWRSQETLDKTHNRYGFSQFVITVKMTKNRISWFALRFLPLYFYTMITPTIKN